MKTIKLNKKHLGQQLHFRNDRWNEEFSGTIVKWNRFDVTIKLDPDGHLGIFSRDELVIVK